MRPLRWTSPACLGLLLVLGGGTASAESLATRTSNHGDVLVQVEAWPEDLLELGFDVWTHHTTTRQALVRVPPQQRALLDATGLSYSIVEPDLGPLVEAESARLAAAARPVAGGSLDPAYYDDYRDLADVQDRLDALISTHPERASLVEIGLSLEGRPIRGVRLSNPGPDDRPVVVVQACQHAREWISVAATMWAAEQLATAPVGGALDGLLDDAELVVVPVVNPDGYQYSWTNERFWRKNRREDFGVDLNRNWSVAWGGQGASNYPYDENYRGAAAFSEPESTAMRDFIAADPHARASLDVHSYGQLVLYPWGFQLDPAPDDLMLSGTSEDIAEAMGLPHGSVYIPLQSAALYPAAGNAMDWAYGELGLHAFGLELRPGPDEFPGFLLGPDEIVPTGEELLASIVVLTETTVELEPGTPGDSGGPVDPDTGTESTGGSADGTGEDPLDTTSTGPGIDEPPPLPGGTAGTEETGAEPPAMDGAEAEGCGCHSGEGTGGAGWMAIALLGLLWRRRRPGRAGG